MSCLIESLGRRSMPSGASRAGVRSPGSRARHRRWQLGNSGRHLLGWRVWSREVGAAGSSAMLGSASRVERKELAPFTEREYGLT